jgi:hypothetical protein
VQPTQPSASPHAEPPEVPDDPEPVVVESSGADEGEQTPAGLSDEEVPPDETEPPEALAARTSYVPVWEKPARLGGVVYPGRPPVPPGSVLWAEGSDPRRPQRSYPIVRHCSWTEEEYVAHELGITRAQIEAGMIKGVYEHTDKAGKKTTVDDRQGRMERSERYLRWRYRGFLAGQIASL